LNYIKRMHPLRGSRMLVAIACFVIAAVCMGVFSRGGDSMHNPGPVIAAHALWQNDCTACHTGSVSGGFSRTVSDQACLKCHDAAIHNHNQVKFMALTHAANCTACHTEHRGRPAMINTASDANCVMCHADINANSKQTPAIAASVTQFAQDKHPHFGRSMGSVDPTELKFNHKYHNTVKGLENNCVACHALTADGRDIQAISYANNCASCHRLNLPADGPTLAHQDLSIVRAQLIALPDAYASIIANDPEKDKKLKTVERVGRPPRVKTIEKTITQGEWVQQQLTALGQTVDKQSADSKEYAELKKSLAPTSQPATAPVSSSSPVTLLEHFVAYSATNSCVKCHEVSGDAGKSLATVPVNMPQRWYVNSVFDHRAHREMTCIDCHTKATSSTLTSDVLSPDIDTKTATGKSCVDCHHADTASARGAAANCTACHQFHQRTTAKALVSVR